MNHGIVAPLLIAASREYWIKSVRQCTLNGRRMLSAGPSIHDWVLSGPVANPENMCNVLCRPFQVHSDELEKCVCETHSTGRICPYHEALKVAPPERSGAMKAVVESHDLAIEAGQLLLTTRAHTQHEDFDRLVRLRGAVEASEEGVVLGKVYIFHTLTAVVSHNVPSSRFHA